MATQERLAKHRWKEVSAIYVDMFEASVIPDAQIARIAFGEYGGPDTPFLRVAVAMPIEDARALVKILGDLIRDMDDEGAERAPDA